MLWVRDAQGRLTAFDAGRLTASVKRAACAQGIPDWWLAEPLGQAVCEYVHHNADDGSFVDVNKLATVIASVLSRLGYPDIATAYQHRSERAEIRLDSLDNGMELEFYRELDAALSRVASPATRRIEVRGLRSCVMRLRGASRWSNGCRYLAEEIVEHVRERLLRLRTGNAEALQLAVKD
jgi:hypothetical protein